MYLEDFFDSFPIGFSKPEFHFISNVKDMMPACWKQTDYGYEATVKTLGIEDVSVEVVDDGVHIFGENELHNNKYKVDITLPIVEDIMGNLTDIKYKVVAGLTFIQLYINRPQKKIVNIEKF